MTIELAHISPHLRAKHSKRARRMALRLDSKERVINLIIPPRANMKKVEAFATKYQDWIARQIANLPTGVPYEDGAIIPICGEDITLDICYSNTLKRTSITLTNNYLSIKTNKENPDVRIERFLKNHARTVLSDLADIKALQIKKKIKNIRIGDTKSRWGSCAHDGRISFSWRLMLAPPAAMDYVVAHEVAHLKHMNHSPKFWALCESLCDDYKTGKDWMREHGHTLLSYGQST